MHNHREIAKRVLRVAAVAVVILLLLRTCVVCEHKSHTAAPVIESDTTLFEGLDSAAMQQHQEDSRDVSSQNRETTGEDSASLSLGDDALNGNSARKDSGSGNDGSGYGNGFRKDSSSSGDDSRSYSNAPDEGNTWDKNARDNDSAWDEDSARDNDSTWDADNARGEVDAEDGIDARSFAVSAAINAAEALVASAKAAYALISSPDTPDSTAAALCASTDAYLLELGNTILVMAGVMPEQEEEQQSEQGRQSSQDEAGPADSFDYRCAVYGSACDALEALLAAGNAAATGEASDILRSLYCTGEAFTGSVTTLAMIDSDLSASIASDTGERLQSLGSTREGGSLSELLEAAQSSAVSSIYALDAVDQEAAQSVGSIAIECLREMQQDASATATSSTATSSTATASTASTASTTSAAIESLLALQSGYKQAAPEDALAAQGGNQLAQGDARADRQSASADSQASRADRQSARAEDRLSQRDKNARRNFPLAIRTNLLLPGLNAGVEVPVSAHSSLEADLYWPWIFPKLLSSDNDRCIEALAARIGYRFWPWGYRTPNGKTGLTGLSFGVNVLGGYYDFEWDYSGAQGEAVAFGADITYSLPIARGRMRLELTAGVGYGYIQYREYKVYTPGGVLIRPANLPIVKGWIPVPTNLAVSLVVPIYSKEKGGKR